MTITSGKYMATLYDAVRTRSAIDGKHSVSFVWDLLDLNQRVTHTVCLADDYGRPDVVASWGVKQWAKGWDGRDLDWFANQIKQGVKIDAWVSVTEGRVNGVFPRTEETSDGGNTTVIEAPRCYSNKPTIIKLETDQEALAQMPAQIEPTFVNAKTLYDAITEKTDREDANLVWTLMAGKIGPMQVDFKPEQWAQMIENIRKLTSCSFVMRQGGVDYRSLRANS